MATLGLAVAAIFAKLGCFLFPRSTRTSAQSSARRASHAEPEDERPEPPLQSAPAIRRRT